MIRRYLARATGEPTTTVDDAVGAVTAAAAQLDCDVVQLEHSIWSFESTGGPAADGDAE